MPISILNLDGSFPISDPHHQSNRAGIIRFIDGTDSLTLPAFQRYQGDVVNRFSLVESKLNEVITAISGNPSLSDWDDSAYVKTNGSSGFTKPVTGVSPVVPADLTTKGYVDLQLEQISLTVTNLASSVSQTRGIRSYSSIWVYVPWSASNKKIIQLDLTSEIPDHSKIISISVVEGIDVAESGAEQFLYRPVNQVTGAKVDDIWLDGSVVKLALPSSALYPTGYPPEYLSTMVVRARKYKATVVVES